MIQAFVSLTTFSRYGTQVTQHSPKYPHPNSHYQTLITKAFMQCNDFATAVAFEFLDSDKVRDPDAFAGTMGRCTSGPQGIVGTNYVSTVTMILIQFCDSDLNEELSSH